MNTGWWVCLCRFGSCALEVCVLFFFFFVEASEGEEKRLEKCGGEGWRLIWVYTLKRA